MAEVLARCGYRCDLCPGYAGNIQSFEDRQKVSDGWFKYYGFRIEPEQIRCDGCRDENPHARRIDGQCKVRTCAIGRGLDTCAKCKERPCQELKDKMVTLSCVVSKSGQPVPKEDYERFVRPYEIETTADC